LIWTACSWIEIKLEFILPEWDNSVCCSYLLIRCKNKHEVIGKVLFTRRIICEDPRKFSLLRMETYQRSYNFIIERKFTATLRKNLEQLRENSRYPRHPVYIWLPGRGKCGKPLCKQNRRPAKGLTETSRKCIHGRIYSASNCNCGYNNCLVISLYFHNPLYFLSSFLEESVPWFALDISGKSMML